MAAAVQVSDSLDVVSHYPSLAAKLVASTTTYLAKFMQNEFIGASTDYWECSKNWLTEDNFPAEHAPCGADRAIFEKVCLSYQYHYCRTSIMAFILWFSGILFLC